MKVKFKIKQQLENFKYRIKEIDENANMKDFNGYHYRITITNKQTKISRNFNYSVGLGYTPEDRTDKKLFSGLLMCLCNDYPYTDIDEIMGLGYDFKKAIQIKKSIKKNNQKVRDLNLDFLFNIDLEELDTELSGEW